MAAVLGDKQPVNFSTVALKGITHEQINALLVSARQYLQHQGLSFEEYKRRVEQTFVAFGEFLPEGWYLYHPAFTDIVEIRQEVTPLPDEKTLIAHAASYLRTSANVGYYTTSTTTTDATVWSVSFK